MIAIEIREAAEADLDDIVLLIEGDSVRGIRRSREDYFASLREIGAHPENQIVVAVAQGRIAGVLQLTFIPGLTYAWRAQVESVRVRTDLRGQGIGVQLMEWVIARAQERQCSLVQLTTNAIRADAQRFYRRLGFEPTHVGMKLYL